MRNSSITFAETLFHAIIKTPFCPTSHTINGQTLPLMCIEIPIRIPNLLHWLHSQEIYPKFYYESPNEGIIIAALGEAFVSHEIPTFPPHSDFPRLFGGIDFQKRKREGQKGIPPCYFALPQIEIEERDQKQILRLYKTGENSLEEIAKKITFDSDIPFEPLFFPLMRTDSPTYSEWERNINEIKQLILQGELEKVVLAREVLFQFENKINPLSLCKELRGKSQTSTLFSFQFSDLVGFISATPEILYHRKGNQIESMALAGTRPLGKDEEEDKLLQSELLESDKERREFSMVARYINASLLPLCKELKMDISPKIIQTSTVQHLHQVFTGILHEDSTDLAIIRKLHPTPAVGGLPLPFALNEISKRECFDRGWYAAPVGWISSKEASIHVAIRSAFIFENRMYLYSGTGIVAGSESASEWNELEYKISQFFLWKTACLK